MNTSFFIAKKLYKGQKGSHSRITKLATQIAGFGVTIGLAVMLVSVCILLGFKHELTEKVYGFSSHIQILNSQANSTLENFPITPNTSFKEKLSQIPNITRIERFSNKMGIIKTDEDFKGIMLKGIAEDYDDSFIRQHLVKGEIPHYNNAQNRNSIVISKLMASQLHLSVGDKLFAYFFENNVRVRLFTISGIYQTHLEQFDESIVFANLYTVNQLNGMSDIQCSGVELYLNDVSSLDNTYSKVLDQTRFMQDADGNPYTAYTVHEIYAQIFNWLKLLDLNVWVILALMICVASFTMISGLLILILEKTSTIGILKAVGSSSNLIRKTFINYTSFILIKGIVLGNILGLGLSLLQQHYHIISLDASKYYVDHVPILIDYPTIWWINIATTIICILAMIGPSYIVSKITPIKAIRFD